MRVKNKTCIEITTNENPIVDYQLTSRETYGNGVEIKGEHVNIVYLTLGLTNEAGEFAGKIKKVFRDKNGVIDEGTKEDLKSELGDVLWYMTQICTNLGLTLEEVAEYNLEKVLSRKQRGTIRGEGDKR